jgi:hypothetical protein
MSLPQPDDRASAPQPETTSVPANPEPAPAQPAPDLGILKQLLDETLSSTAAAADPKDLAALRAVAQAFPGLPFGLAIAVELILAALRGQFSQRDISDATLRTMATQIAATLCNDPASRARLETLWGRLCEQCARP